MEPTWASKIMDHVVSLFPEISNIHFLKIDEEDALPAIVVRITNDFPEVYYPGALGISIPELELSIYATTYASGDAIHETLKNEFSGKPNDPLYQNSRFTYTNVFVDEKSLNRIEATIELTR